MNKHRLTITIEIDVTLDSPELGVPDIHSPDPFELRLARQLDGLLRDGSVAPSSLFVYHGCDVSFGNFSGAFAVENPCI